MCFSASVSFGMGALLIATGAVTTLGNKKKEQRNDNPVQSYSAGHSIGYAFPNVQKFWPDSIDFLFYDTPTVVPFFVSSLRIVKKAGYLVVASLIATQTINQQATTSVWCFFAALISLYIAVNVLVKQEQKLA